MDAGFDVFRALDSGLSDVRAYEAAVRTLNLKLKLHWKVAVDPIYPRRGAPLKGALKGTPQGILDPETLNPKP